VREGQAVAERSLGPEVSRPNLAEIGARGGRKSRRTLSPETARAMVRVREARRAFRRYRTMCFWSYRPDLDIREADVAKGGRAADETRQPRGMAHRSQALPLTVFQRELLAALASSPNDGRYLAGDAAIHFEPHSTRYSDDLDFFHDSEARVTSAFAHDPEVLTGAAYSVDVDLVLSGFVRAVVRRGGRPHGSIGPTIRRGGSCPWCATSWADCCCILSTWRSTRYSRSPAATSLGTSSTSSSCTGASSRCPAFVGRLRGRTRVLRPYHSSSCSSATDATGPRTSRGLRLAEPFDLSAAKQAWLSALADADTFARERPPDESGCLYYSTRLARFVIPAASSSLAEQAIVPHFGAPGGVLPRITDERIDMALEGG
jgi:hypothetical protein